MPNPIPKPSVYKVGIGSKTALVESFRAKNRGHAYQVCMNRGALTLQQATDILDACDHNGKGGCFNVRGLLVQVEKT